MINIIGHKSSFLPDGYFDTLYGEAATFRQLSPRTLQGFMPGIFIAYRVW